MSEYTFEPFQKVLVRISGEWCASFYSHRVEDSGRHVTTDYNELSPDVILPYTDETKHLLGTKDDFKPKWQPKPGELVAVSNDGEIWLAQVYLSKNREGAHLAKSYHGGTDYVEYNYCEPLRNHFNVPEEA